MCISMSSSKVIVYPLIEASKEGQLDNAVEMKDIAYQQLGMQGQMVAQQVALNNSISILT